MRFITIHQPDSPGVPMNFGSNANKCKTRALRRIIRIKRKLDGIPHPDASKQPDFTDEHPFGTPLLWWLRPAHGRRRKRLNRQVRELARVAGL